MMPHRWWLRGAPAERLAVLRIIVGLYGLIYLLIRTPHLLSYALDEIPRFQPVGIVTLAETPTLPWVYRVLVVITLILAGAFLLGYRHRFLAPVYAGMLLWVLTYTNSWGKILHTDNLLVLHVGILALTRSADVLSFDAQQARAKRDLPSHYGWPIKLMAAVCALVYLLAGIAKIRNSGFALAEGETLRNYIAFVNVRKIELGSAHSPIGVALLAFPSLFQGLGWFSLVLELGAPAAVLSHRLGKWWSWSVWGFHFGVLLLMAIGFVYQLTMVAFAPFFHVEKLLDWGPIARRLPQNLQRTPETAQTDESE